MSAEKSGFGSTEDRLANWAGWINRLEPVDKSDAKVVDDVIRKLPDTERQVVKAMFVQWPKQSVYFLAAELALPPYFINRVISKVKADVGRTAMG